MEKVINPVDNEMSQEEKIDWNKEMVLNIYCESGWRHETPFH